jgi:hypothetical protein
VTDAGIVSPFDMVGAVAGVPDHAEIVSVTAGVKVPQPGDVGHHRHE